MFEFKKRIVFFGMPDMANTVLSYIKRANVNIVGVVCPPKNVFTSAAFANYAKALGYETIIPDEKVSEERVIEWIKNLDADLGVVASYTQKFSPELLAATKDGCVNLHPSLLPEYRGPNPYSNVILNNEPISGVTLHKMNENFDEGNILVQRKVALTHNETMGTIFNKLNSIGAETLIQFLAAYETEGLFEGTPQDTFPKPLHYAKRIVQHTSDTMIDWTRPAVEIERQIRALNPFLAATTLFQGILLKIFTADILDVKSKYEPGTVCAIGDTIDVATGDGILKIRSLQFGNFLLGDSRDFVERISLSVGHKLG